MFNEELQITRGVLIQKQVLQVNQIHCNIIGTEVRKLLL